MKDSKVSWMCISLRHAWHAVPLPRDRGLISVVSEAIAPPWRYADSSLGLRRLWLSVANGRCLFLPLATSIGSILLTQSIVSYRFWRVGHGLAERFDGTEMK
jgi:hypothetical protein